VKYLRAVEARLQLKDNRSKITPRKSIIRAQKQCIEFTSIQGDQLEEDLVFKLDVKAEREL
jgi:hypothetical protein